MRRYKLIASRSRSSETASCSQDVLIGDLAFEQLSCTKPPKKQEGSEQRNAGADRA
jgi:hypothetical protein